MKPRDGFRDIAAYVDSNGRGMIDIGLPCLINLAFVSLNRN